MMNQAKDLLFSDTSRDTAIVFAGTLINVAAGGLFFILVPRILGPADYGLFATVISTSLLATSIANLGLDTGILRFVTKNKVVSESILSLAFKSYLVLGFSTAFLGFLLSPLLANFLGQTQITTLLRIAFSFTIFTLLSNFFVAALQARKEFFKASVVNFSSNITRLALLLIAFYFFLVNVYFLTLIFFSVTLVSVIFGKIFLKFHIRESSAEVKKDYFKFNFWIALSLILSSIPFDNYFLLKLTGPFQAGLYSAPFKLLTFVYQFGGNFTRVLASRFASFENDIMAKQFSLKALPLIAIFVFGLLILYLISAPIVKLLFGREFVEAIPLMKVLIIGFIFFFAATIPSSIILYYFGKSNVSFVITCLRYLVFILLLAALVPTKKAYGAALAFTSSELVNFLAMIGYVAFKFSSKKNGH